jgi:hypothetical protein
MHPSIADFRNTAYTGRESKVLRFENKLSASSSSHFTRRRLDKSAHYSHQPASRSCYKPIYRGLLFRRLFSEDSKTTQCCVAPLDSKHYFSEEPQCFRTNQILSHVVSISDSPSRVAQGFTILQKRISTRISRSEC